MERDRSEDGREDNNGRLLRESKEALRVWAAYYNALLNGKRAASCLEVPGLVMKEVEVDDIRQEEVETAIVQDKKAKCCT